MHRILNFVEPIIVFFFFGKIMLKQTQIDVALAENIAMGVLLLTFLKQVILFLVAVACARYL